MSTVTCINEYRRTRRNEYLAQHGDRIESFIRNFIRFNFTYDFQNIADAYVSSLKHANLASWDYRDLREELREAVTHQLSEAVFQELCKTHWFNKQYVDVEQIADRCFSIFILEDWAAIS